MNESLPRNLQGCAKYLALAWRRLWFAPPLQLRAAEALLELPLRPAPRLRVARRVLLLLILGYALELTLTGHRAMMLLALLAATGFGPVPRVFRADRKIPDHLLLLPDGRLWISYSGAVEEVTLQPESMRLGPHLLLVLRDGRHSLRLLLGPDNLAAADLAALRRRLPSGPVAPATALHSPPASGSQPDPT